MRTHLLEAAASRRRWAKLGLLAMAALVGQGAQAALPVPDHVLVVVEENKAFSNIIGKASAPYINSLVAQGALMTQSFGMGHPSQPNYLQLFSGSNQGVTDNTTPQSFATPNLRSALAAQGRSFTGYSESMPSVGFTGDAFTTVVGQNQYQRKHNPWVNWQGAASNAVPAAENQPFSAFPSDYSTLPTVAFVVPNEQNDMHDGSVANGDAWLQSHIQGYVDWAQTHNSLLVLTFDEDDGSENNRVVTLFVGPMVLPGSYSQTVNHLNVLRTIADMYGATPPGDSATAAAITAPFISSPVPEPSAAWLLSAGLPGLLLWRRAKAKRPR